MPLTPQDFVSKWKRVNAREKQTYQEHFIDLCHLVGHPTPNDYDPTGRRFAFEMGVAKTSGRQGWADVAKLGFFGWEYKGKDSDLEKAYDQLLRYRDSLQNPPLLIVSDINNIIIRTNYTNLPTRTYTLTLDDLLKPESINILKIVFFTPEQLKPQITIEGVTREAASQFSRLAENLRKYGSDPQDIAHFLIRLLFCLFAEDIGLLPEKLFPRLLEQTRHNSKDFSEVLRQLFRAMNTGGYFGSERILHFNGGLFDNENVLPLDRADMDIIADIDALDWGAIEPSIFGTLFERGLDPSKRSQLGAHYTSKEDILLIVEPVLMAPLRREWEQVKQDVRVMKEAADQLEKGRKKSALQTEISFMLRAFSERIGSITVLDPACGSGNFLYVALRLLLDLQNDVINFSDEMGAGRFFVSVTPAQLFGIEINEYAHELAQMTIQIGYIQWLRDNGYGQPAEPILKPMKNILHMDAILGYETSGVSLKDSLSAETSQKTPEVYEPEWPEVDVIVGNPPFLGGNRIRGELGSKYVGDLFRLYNGRVPAFADLVCYWFEKARAMIEAGKAKRAGLLATNSIRGGVNRRVLQKIKETGDIFWAQSNRDWVLDGAAVNVSMVGFDNSEDKEKKLDDQTVSTINSDLTAATNLTLAQRLAENEKICFIGTKKAGAFDIDSNLAKQFLSQSNPNGKSNRDVLFKWMNGKSIVGKLPERWIINFGDMPLEEAALYEKPFEYVKQYVYPERQTNNEERARVKWWQHRRPATEMRESVSRLTRYIATPRVSKHRIFVWVSPSILPDDGVYIFAREDHYFFGVLHSKIHEIWALKQGTSLEDRPRYTPTSTFETFPFPWAPGAEPKNDPRVQAISQAAKELVEQRDRWLNAEGLSEAEKKKRTLTNLYNARPTWLDLAHKRLDQAVFAAYGWNPNLSDEEILEKLLALNLERAALR